MDEKALVRRCLAGDSAAWKELMETHAPAFGHEARRALRRFAGNAPPGLEQDLCQEIVLALMENESAALRNFRWNCSLSHYLAVVAATRCAHVLTRKRVPAPADPFRLEGTLLSEVAPGLEAGEARETVRSALDRIPARERLALQLHYWEELPADTVARMLSIGKDSVRMLLTRARRELARALKEKKAP